MPFAKRFRKLQPNKENELLCHPSLLSGIHNARTDPVNVAWLCFGPSWSSTGPVGPASDLTDMARANTRDFLNVS